MAYFPETQETIESTAALPPMESCPDCGCLRRRFTPSADYAGGWICAVCDHPEFRRLAELEEFHARLRVGAYEVE